MMSRTLKKKLLPVAVAATLVGGFSANVNAIHVAEDGIGQLLLAPMYWANDPASVGSSYNTEFAITNTRTDTAVKVKITFRSRIASTECLDFICYMSPGDVCRFNAGVLSTGATGVYSTDDSVKSAATSGNGEVDSLAAAATSFGSRTRFEAPWQPRSLGDGDTCDMGHVEVLSLYGVQNSVVGYNAAGQQERIVIQRGMSKFQLAKVFDTPRTVNDIAVTPNRVHTTVAYGPDGVLNTADDLTLALANNGTNTSTREQDVRNAITGVEPLSTLAVLNPPNIRSTDPSWIRLTGTAVISTSNDRMSYRIPALAGSIGDNVSLPYAVPTGVYTGTVAGVSTLQAMFDGLVVSNPRFDQTVAQETGIGDQFGVRPILGYPSIGQPYFDKLIEIERALAATNQQGNFDIAGDKNTFLQTTLPTRYRHLLNDPCNTGFVFDQTNNRLFSPPFEPAGGLPISVSIYDDFENTEIPTGGIFLSPAPIIIPDVIKLVETNYYIPNWVSNFERGWFNVSLQAQSNTVAGVARTCPYPGVAALGNVHDYIVSNGLPSQSMMKPMSHQPILVCDEATAVGSCSYSFQ